MREITVPGSLRDKQIKSRKKKQQDSPPPNPSTGQASKTDDDKPKEG